MASHDERRRSSRNSISSSDAELIRDHSRRLGLASPSASSASSQLLDPSTVGALSSHFDQLLGAIAGRIESVSVGANPNLHSTKPPTAPIHCRQSHSRNRKIQRNTTSD
ncbi:hypothetical protein TWF173_003148 [Orbilia oligospora]|uniref:Uncharacterized protein n=1 Tax=Orbilia oligospora TaxID=2813651 RepID=A0A7C8REL0_ORBOL|nr:hypothetical protein TWF970_003940 [Orbilia oligospora]KAF3307433.1 hypothetical protein TWF173_003148 [Orbilia oligospora]